jgi:hypothetical protein
MFGADNPEALRLQTGLLRFGRVVVPVLTFIATLIAAIKLDAFRFPLAGVDSPLVATVLLGLSLFPGGTFFILRGLVIAARRRESKFWPAVKGFILPRDSSSGGLWEFFRYGFNGRGLESSFLSFRLFRVGQEVEVRVDPEDPEVAIVVSGDHTAQMNIWFGVLALATAPGLGSFLVWLGS